jgi:hypothetical protein
VVEATDRVAEGDAIAAGVTRRSLGLSIIGTQLHGNADDLGPAIVFSLVALILVRFSASPGGVRPSPGTAVRAVDPGTSPPRRFTSPISYGALLHGRVVSPGLLVTLGVAVSEDGAALQDLGCLLKGRLHAMHAFPHLSLRGF